MVEGGSSGSGGHSGSSSSSHSSSSSSSSRSRDTRLLIRVSPSVQSERIHSFFDRSLSLAKPPIGPGFVKKVYRKSEDRVILSIEDASIARRLVSSFSDSRPKIDGHEFTIEFYCSDHSKSLSSPSNHNGDKRKEKELTRMSSCPSQPSLSSKRSSQSSPSTNRPSTSTNDSIRNECFPSSSSSIPMDPYDGIIGVALHRLPFMAESILKEILSVGLREIGGYLTHFTEDSGRIKVLLKRNLNSEGTPSEEKITVQGEDVSFTTLSCEETRNLYDRYSSSDTSRSSIPSSSSSSHSFRCSSSRDAMSYDSSRTVFIPCLPKGVTRDYFRKRFHKMGAIIDVELKNVHSVSPHAIVQFAHTQAAVMAMEDYEREQREEGARNPLRNRKRPHFIRSPSSIRVWVANLPFQEEDYVKKKLLELLKGAQNPTIVVDLRRREGIIDFSTQERAKHFLEVIKSSPLIQQNGQVQTWLVADYCSEELYNHFRDRRGINPSTIEVEYVSILSKRVITDTQRDEAVARMDKMKEGDEKPIEKKKIINGENGNHVHSPTSSRRSNAEDRRSGDSGFSEDREKILALDSDDDEVLEAKWTKAAVPIDRSEENGKLRERLMKMGDAMEAFYKSVPQKEKRVKKEVEEEGRENSEKIPREERINYFRDALLNVTTPLKARSDEMGGYRGNPLRSPPIPISPLNGDKRHTVRSPPTGTRPAPLHINIPPSTSTAHSTIHSPYTRLPSSSSRHPSISTPSTLTPRCQTMPSTLNRPPFPIESNGDHGWNGIGAIPSNSGTPTSSRLPLSRRESVCSNSSQSYTPLPPSLPSTSGGVYTPTPLKSPPVATWSSTSNAWKGGPSLSSPNPSSINRSRPSMDSHHKPSSSSISRPGLPGLPKSNLEKSGFGHNPHPKTPSLPRSTSMNEKKPNLSRDPSKDFVNNLIHNKNGSDLKKMPRIPKKENRERDEKEERKEKKREEKDRERRDERKEKKEDRKKSRENESKEEKAKRKELKRKEKEKEERKKSINEKEKKKKNAEGEKKKKKKHSRAFSDSADSDLDSDDSIFKPGSSSKQMEDDEALARSLAGSSMYDRVKVRRSGSNREEKKKIDALEAIRKKKKKEMKTKKRAHLSSSSESEEEVKESGKKSKKEEEESSDGEEEERRMKEKKKEKKKREKERRDSSDESDSDDERAKKRKKKEKKVSKKNSLLDLFSDKDEVDSVKSEKKEKLSKKRSLERDDSPSSSSHPPPGKKVKKEESSSSGSESDEGERSSKKSEVSLSSWKDREEKMRRLSESSVATEKDEVWKSPASGSVEKEIKEEPKEDRPPPRLMTKAAMKEFGGGASSSPAGRNWNKDDSRRDLNLSSDSSQSSSESEEEKEEREERRDDEDNHREEEREEEERMEEESEERREEEMAIEEKKDDEIKEEVKEEEEVKMEVEESPMDEETESAVRGLESPSEEVIEETEKAVESIFDEEEEPEARYPSNDFLNPSDMNLSSSSSQCSSPKILPSSSSLLHRPTPLHPHSIPSPLHPHLHSHSIPPISSPLVSPHLISPSGSRPSSINQYQIRPISQESSSQHLHDENGVIIHQERTWTSQGSSSDGLSPSPNHHPTMNKEEIVKRFPVKWSGPMKMRANEMQTLWYKLHGDDGLLDSAFSSLNAARVEVRGKLRLNNEKVRQLVTSMDNGEEHACLIVTPAGITQDDVVKNRDIFSKHLVTYFQNKEIAGVAEFPTLDGPPYMGHCFAPGDFVTEYLSPMYPDFLDLLNKKYANAFLLVILKREE